ncbi:MAG: crossover junction endodeoxyribonuclease RuvC [Pseudomonadota bacterium]
MAHRRIIGLDPGLQATGWGIVESDGLRLRHIAHGTVRSEASDDLADRLLMLHDGLAAILAEHAPDEAAVEETFVNKNPVSTLKLGQARGVCLLVPALAGLSVAEYAPNHIKKAVVGVGHAGKQQVAAMIATLLPAVPVSGADAIDALAVAICHAHQRGPGAQRLKKAAGAHR